jgi:ATP-dependent helicase/nuclease subunit B
VAVRRLLTGPVGPGSTFTVLAEAANAARAGRAFALLLPTQAAMEHARNELARRNQNCDPRRIFTPTSLARALLGPAAPRLASPRERDAHLARALAAYADSPTALPEHELALRYRGFRTGLLYVFDELEANGLTASTLARKLRVARMEETRVRRLVSIYESYRRRLKQAHLYPQSDLLHQATLALTRGREVIPVPELLLVDGFSDLNPRQVALLNALALKADETVVTWAVADEAAPTGAFTWPNKTRDRLISLGFEAESRVAADDPRPSVLRRLARDLFTGGAKTEGAEDTKISSPEGLKVVRAASRRDEIEYALARAREFVTASSARRWTDVLVVVPDVRRYRAPIEQVGKELGVPVRVRGTLPLSQSPLVQGAMAFLRAASTFELGPLLVAAACPAFGLDPDEADRLARAARRSGLPATGSPELWVELGRELGGRAALFLRQALELGRALNHVTEEPRSGRVTTGPGCREARRTLEPLLRASGVARLCQETTQEAVAEAAAEVAARRDLLALLADLERLDVPVCGGGQSEPAQHLLARIEEEVRSCDTRPLDRRRHVVHVVDAREARAWEADLVLVLGLVEREFPRPDRDDLFLPEETRRALSSNSRGKKHLQVRTAEDRSAEDVFLFYSAVTRARRELWLFYPGFSPSGNPLRASRFLDSVRELLTPTAWDEACLLRTPGDLVSDEPELLLTENALRRFAYRRVASVSRPTGPEAPRVRLATAVFQELLSTDPLELDRAAIALRRPYAALKGGPGAAKALERVYSASELETFATCPFRHFVSYLLGIRRADDLAHSGLDALRRGTVVHNALQRVYEQGDAPDRALDEEFSRGARRLDIGLEEDAFRRHALEAIESFVGEDDPAFRRATGLEPSTFEHGFGPETAVGALSIPAPHLGGTIELRGKIDRIDLLPAEEGEERRAAYVTDYKLGGKEVDGAYLSAMHAGEQLQVPIYLLAVQRVLGMRPLGAGFAALGTRRRTGVVDPEVGAFEAGTDERRVRMFRVPLERTLGRTEEHIRRYVGGIANGVIDPSPREPTDCKRCDAKDVCRTSAHEARRRARRGRPLQLAGT